ncbi:hypothetical protein DBV05_g5252 [Lasiodiplodia theobromae]|uniref:Uncharacterized protein n=1 Tax=Lasiodiplodia theobromae TaxID=45133 RepID=A0A5N5DEU6_9PEZI|nr:hypothetical protein DBV05_g5252 [Lasiodiplodia theobromae]
MCETIIECLRLLDWEYAEIAKSKAGLVKILGRYVDLEALSKKEENHLGEVAVDEGEVQEENAMHLDDIHLSDFEGPFTLDANTALEIPNPPDLNIFGGIGDFRFDANAAPDIFNVPDENHFDGTGIFRFDANAAPDIFNALDEDHFDGTGIFRFDPETAVDILNTSDVNLFRDDGNFTSDSNELPGNNFYSDGHNMN